MVTADSGLAKIRITNRTRVVAVFFLSGLWSGLISGWLSTTPGLRSVLYVQGDTSLMPTYRVWVGFGLIFSLALVIAYVVARVFHWLTLSPSAIRQLLALLLLALSPVLLYVSTHANSLIAGIYYMAFLPLAMCIITGRLRLLALAVLQNFLALIAFLIVMYLVFLLFKVPFALNVCVQAGLSQSLFAAAFGAWLSWTPARLGEGNA